jgi:hypothetical protein
MQNTGEGWLHKHIVLFRMLQFKTGFWGVKWSEELKLATRRINNRPNDRMTVGAFALSGIMPLSCTFSAAAAAAAPLNQSTPTRIQAKGKLYSLLSL